jgi:hypothetical protein
LRAARVCLWAWRASLAGSITLLATNPFSWQLPEGAELGPGPRKDEKNNTVRHLLETARLHLRAAFHIARRAAREPA